MVRRDSESESTPKEREWRFIIDNRNRSGLHLHDSSGSKRPVFLHTLVWNISSLNILQRGYAAPIINGYSLSFGCTAIRVPIDYVGHLHGNNGGFLTWIPIASNGGIY